MFPLKGQDKDFTLVGNKFCAVFLVLPGNPSPCLCLNNPHYLFFLWSEILPSVTDKGLNIILCFQESFTLR